MEFAYIGIPKKLTIYIYQHQGDSDGRTFSSLPLPSLLSCPPPKPPVQRAARENKSTQNKKTCFSQFHLGHPTKQTLEPLVRLLSGRPKDRT